MAPGNPAATQIRPSGPKRARGEYRWRLPYLINLTARRMHLSEALRAAWLARPRGLDSGLRALSLPPSLLLLPVSYNITIFYRTFLSLSSDGAYTSMCRIFPGEWGFPIGYLIQGVWNQVDHLHTAILFRTLVPNIVVIYFRLSSV